MYTCHLFVGLSSGRSKSQRWYSLVVDTLRCFEPSLEAVILVTMTCVVSSNLMSHLCATHEQQVKILSDFKVSSWAMTGPSLLKGYLALFLMSGKLS